MAQYLLKNILRKEKVQLIFVDLDTREVLDVMPTKRSKKVKKTDMTNVVLFERKDNV